MNVSVPGMSSLNTFVEIRLLSVRLCIKSRLNLKAHLFIDFKDSKLTLSALKGITQIIDMIVVIHIRSLSVGRMRQSDQ